MAMKIETVEIKYVQMGMAALLPGMVHMLELMQTEVERMQIQLAALQGAQATETVKKASPRRAPAARKKETPLPLQRRKTSSQLSAERKKAWAALSPAKKKKRLAAMLAGRKKLAVAA